MVNYIANGSTYIYVKLQNITIRIYNKLMIMMIYILMILYIYIYAYSQIGSGFGLCHLLRGLELIYFS